MPRGALGGIATKREPLIPVMKPDDTVLVQVVLPERRLVTPAPGEPVRGQEIVGGNAQNPSGANQPILANSSTNAGPARQYLEPIELEAEERRKLQDLVDLIRLRNPYKLDRNGALNLPGFAPIPLGGLTEVQATQRLGAEPALLKLDVKLVRLPLAKSGLEGLKRFGYDLFDDVPSTFSPMTDVPVPAEYVVGPGDQLIVQLFGSQNVTHRLTVNRDGSVAFPQLGPIRVGGLSFNAAQRRHRGARLARHDRRAGQRDDRRPAHDPRLRVR